jgi:hypothetical protein
MTIPALNEITRQALDEPPEYTDNPEERQYIILFPEDYDGHGSDMAGNVALLVDKEQAEEIKRLAEEAIEALE